MAIGLGHCRRFRKDTHHSTDCALMLQSLSFFYCVISSHPCCLNYSHSVSTVDSSVDFRASTSFMLSCTTIPNLFIYSIRGPTSGLWPIHFCMDLTDPPQFNLFHDPLICSHYRAIFFIYHQACMYIYITITCCWTCIEQPLKNRQIIVTYNIGTSSLHA